MWTFRPRQCLLVLVQTMLTSNSVLFYIFPDWGRRRVHLHSRAEPPQSATGPAANPTGCPRHCSPAHSRFCCSRFDTHAYVISPFAPPPPPAHAYKPFYRRVVHSLLFRWPPYFDYISFGCRCRPTRLASVGTPCTAPDESGPLPHLRRRRRHGRQQGRASSGRTETR